jgi:hypothetical protein
MSEPALKKKMSTGAKWGAGCGIGCLTLLVLVAAAAFLGYRFAKGKLDQVKAEMRQLGFERIVTRQVAEVRDPGAVPTLYIGQVVQILGDCHTNLAIVAQVGEIHGRVSGNVFFRGQMLTVQPKAEILGSLDASAQVVQKYGAVRGEVTGRHLLLNEPAAR